MQGLSLDGAEHRVRGMDGRGIVDVIGDAPDRDGYGAGQNDERAVHRRDIVVLHVDLGTVPIADAGDKGVDRGEAIDHVFGTVGGHELVADAVGDVQGLPLDGAEHRVCGMDGRGVIDVIGDAPDRDGYGAG